MKVRVTKDCDHRVGPAVTMAFRPRPEPYDVPAEIGQALVEKGAAEHVRKPKTATQEG